MHPTTGTEGFAIKMNNLSGRKRAFLLQIGFRAASVVALLYLAGCAQGSFDRFMDHPILSWLPLDKWGVVGGTSRSARQITAFPDKGCYQIAQERTEFLDQSEYDDADLRKIFAMTYRDCMKFKD